MHPFKKSALIVVAVLMVAMAGPARARATDLALHGFLQGNYAFNTAGENPDGGDLKWAEERVQLKLDGSSDPFYLSIKADAFHDRIEGEADAELREGYIDFVSGGWDVRAGRQVITWGIGDLLFVNDVFPKDYEAFYAGRPLEYLKKGIDAIKVGLYPGVANFELVISPTFEPNTLPRGERFHNSMDPDAEEPAATPENTEAALRAYRSIGELDASLYFYRGFSRLPSMRADGEFFYPELSVYGASIEGRALSGILGAEAGYYDSREDRGGDDPTVPNSTTRLLVSYKRQLVEDFNLGLQYYIELMQGYSDYERTLPEGYSREDRLYHLSSLRLTRLLMHQNMRLSLFAFYSPSDDDHVLNPEVNYKFTDRVWASLGGNIFGGRDEGRFGNLDRNDNIYLQARYEL
jgi:hypothetical protein